MAVSPASRSKSKSRGITLARFSAVTTVMLFAGVGAAVLFTYGRMERTVSGIIRTPVKVEFEWPLLRNADGPTLPNGQPATWLSEPFRNQLLVMATTVLNDDPFDRNALERCGQAMLDSGWFKKVRSIRRDRDGVVCIAGDWRAPAAAVRHDDRDYVVSREGELLPVDYKPGGSGLRVIVNPYAPPPTRPGEKWLGGDVQASLALLTQLQASPAYTQVAAIDAGAYVSKKRLEIVTDTGNRVVWGAAPGEFSPSEVSTQTKLGRLQFLISSPDFGKRIDAGKPLVDIASPRDILIDVSAQPSPAVTIPAGGSGKETGAAPADDSTLRSTVAKRPAAKL